MPISDAAVHSVIKTWGAVAILDGDTFAIEGDLPIRSMSLTQPRSVCSFQVRDFPDVASGSDGQVVISLNGEEATFFTGFVADRPVTSGYQFQVNLVDLLGDLDTPLSDEMTWVGTSFIDAVRDFLHAAGITDEQIASIFDPGEDFSLGVEYPIVIPAGANIKQVIDELLKFAGCALLVTEEGLLEVVNFPGWGTPDEESPVYANGADRSLDEFGFEGSSRVIGGAEGRVSSFTAVGPKRPDLHIPDATFTIAEMVGKGVTENYPYLQTDETAEVIAEREVVRRNYAETLVEVTAPLNPNLTPGDSLWFRDNVIGFLENTAAIVVGIRTRSDQMTLTLSVGAEPAEGELTLIPPPEASFTYQAETQPVSLAGITQTSIVVQCTNTSSDPSDFTITSISWEAACNGEVSPASSTEQDPIFIFSTLDGAVIILTIEASSGEGDILTQPIEPLESETFTRQLTVAAGPDGWKVLVDAGGWRTWDAGADCTAVPNINDSGALLAGFANGELYATSDALLSPPTLLYTFPDSVTCIFVNELDPTHIVVGAGNVVYITLSAGLVWNDVHTFDDPVVYIETSPEIDIKIRVCAGNILWWSDDGDDWTALVTGPEDSDCRKVASAPWGHLAVFDGVADLADAWAFEEVGYTIDWAGVPAEELPTALSSVTPWQYAEGYVVSSGGGAADLIRDGLFGQLTYLAAPSSPTQLYKLTQSAPGAFVAAVIGTATESGPMKVVNHAGAFKIDDVDVAYRIGYGQAINPLLPPKLILLPVAASGADDVLYLYDPAEGFTTLELPTAGKEWRGVVINPNNQSEWIIWWGNASDYLDDYGAGAYLTTNSGGTWFEITELGPASAYSRHIGGVCWTGTESTWFIVGARNDTFLLRVATYNQTGEGDTIFDAYYDLGAALSTSEYIARGIIAGIGADVIGYRNDSLYDWVIYPYSTANYASVVYNTGFRPQDLLTGMDKQLVAIQDSNIGYSADYSTDAPTPIISAGTSVVAMADGTLLVGGRTGIVRITGFPDSAASTIEAAGGVVISRMNRGPTRRYAAALGDDGNVYGHNGLQWGSVALPLGVTFCPQIGVLELS